MTCSLPLSSCVHTYITSYTHSYVFSLHALYARWYLAVLAVLNFSHLQIYLKFHFGTSRFRHLPVFFGRHLPVFFGHSNIYVDVIFQVDCIVMSPVYVHSHTSALTTRLHTHLGFSFLFTNTKLFEQLRQQLSQTSQSDKQATHIV